jgi:thiamine-phosphate pyrophosphorylase
MSKHKKMIRTSLLASPETLENEWDILTELFDAGLEKFYLRKPGLRLRKYEECLSNIPERFLERVVLHEHFTIMYDYPFKEIHLKTRERKAFENKERFRRLIKEAHKENILCSSSVHNLDELRQMDGLLDSIWVSPVYDSISNPTHVAEIDWILALKNLELNSKIVALGGIHENNVGALMRSPFSEVALLGSIWNRPESAVENFKKIVKACHESTTTY